MCCFSRNVEKVWSTRIFARPLEDGRQLIVYDTSLEVTEDVAMILPIPVPRDAEYGAVKFVDMAEHDDFFEDLPKLFANRAMRAELRDDGGARGHRTDDVGDFEPSFVHGQRELEDLSARYRLPDDVWRSLPSYVDWGFCVLKVRRIPGKRASLFEAFKPHPPVRRKMRPVAFAFPRRDPGTLFFPTVHVHDGHVHPMAEYDHELYCQTEPEWEPVLDWQRSASRADRLPDAALSGLAPSGWLYRRSLIGELPNRDTFLNEARLRARVVVSDMLRLRMRAAWEHLIDDGKTELEPRVKKWMRVGEAERVRVRDMMLEELTPLFSDKADAWGLARFAHDQDYETFSASNDRIEPQEIDVAFRAAPTAEVRTELQQAVQRALDRATVDPR